jgi:hypothetical protein
VAVLWGAILGSSLACARADAQDIEPRAYSNAPIGVNFLVAGYVRTEDGLSFDPALPIKNPDLQTQSALLAYGRVIDLWGTSGKVDVIVPYTFLSGSADYFGDRIDRVVDGFADTRFRLSINLVGAPSLSLQEFRSYRQTLLIGATLQVFAPTGQYDPSRLVNIGANRWTVRPEVGVSRAVDRCTFELLGGAMLFTDNPNFYGGSRRQQAPLAYIQGSTIYGFRSGIWGSIGAMFLNGGRTTVDGVRDRNLQQNWRVGGTVAFPIDRKHSVKFYFNTGVYARTGNNYDAYGVAWQYRWGAGL